jgi:hypothetical protein
MKGSIMELISTYGPRTALKMPGPRARPLHRPLQLRYALAAIFLSMMGAHISADFEEPPGSAKSASLV